jgi:deoxyribodipyrimidine photo-lyase
MIDRSRARILNKGVPGKGPVVYWMSRDQRVHDNWALMYARELSAEQRRELVVVFTLVPDFPNATLRSCDFMLRGLSEVEQTLDRYNIPFFVLKGNPPGAMKDFADRCDASRVITDFDPLRIKREWKSELKAKSELPLIEVDAHNIVPCFVASNKQEFGAYTLRPKITRLLPEYLVEYPALRKQSGSSFPSNNNWDQIRDYIQADHSVEPVEWLIPGEQAAKAVLDDFIDNRLGNYAVLRNDPNENGTSNLSPYLHFGHVSAQRAALEISKRRMKDDNTDTFLEELIIRRELSDNYCYYNPDYDNLDRIPEWARITLDKHRRDEREHLYSTDEFERALTHDSLWNAAQIQMVKQGKMHGYLRMYWAKKILEWTESPEQALQVSIYLNDRYELDGRDPNGYTGCAWSIAGIHDRAWQERPVFGKIRYMNYNGCKRKFNVEKYIKSVRSEE